MAVRLFFLAAVLILASSIGLASSRTHKTTNPETRFLLEILMGRCYDEPPSFDDTPEICPSLIPGLVGVLQSHLDSDIKPNSFESYIEATDFAPPENKAFFLLGTKPGQSVGDGAFVPPGLMRPEDTPGGSIMTGLVFCGTDSQMDCSFGTFDSDAGVWSGAQASFWFGAYASFASLAKGKVQAMVLIDGVSYDEDSVDLFSSAAVPNFDPSVITEFDIYAVNSESDGEALCDIEVVRKLAESLEEVGIKHTCTEDSDWSHLFFCSSSLGSKKACSVVKSMATDAKTSPSKAESSTQSGSTTSSEESHYAKPGAAIIPALIWIVLFGGVIAFLVKKVGWLNENNYDEVPEQNPEYTCQPTQ